MLFVCLFVYLFVCIFVCFVLFCFTAYQPHRSFNATQVKENKSEKIFKMELLGINDYKKNPVKQVGEGISLLEYIL